MCSYIHFIFYIFTNDIIITFIKTDFAVIFNFKF